MDDTYINPSDNLLEEDGILNEGDDFSGMSDEEEDEDIGDSDYE